MILPGQTIGIIGGGQLGRMMAIAAKEMGYRILVLDPTENCPTAQVADEQIIAAYDDMKAIETLTDKSDVVTYEFENVDVTAATYIEEKGKLPQGARALKITQNRQEEKQLLKDAGLPVPFFAIVNNRKACEEALEKVTLPAVVKTCRGGYDGKGQLKINEEADFSAVIEFVENNGTCIIEEWIPFDKEVSVIFSRAQTGEITYFPLAENDHENHILARTTVPAHVSEGVEEKVMKAAEKIATEMDIVGTFAVEIFVRGEEVFINEMAPRPHNSGHYTIEACNISQFTQHIRAICGLPLIEVSLLQAAVMINILGEHLPGTLRAMQENPTGFVHLYGKSEPKDQRKMGHITFIAEELTEVRTLVEQYKKEMQ